MDEKSVLEDWKSVLPTQSFFDRLGSVLFCLMGFWIKTYMFVMDKFLKYSKWDTAFRFRVWKHEIMIKVGNTEEMHYYHLVIHFYYTINIDTYYIQAFKKDHTNRIPRLFYYNPYFLMRYFPDRPRIVLSKYACVLKRF